MDGLKEKFGHYAFWLSLAILIFFSPGFIEAEDSWLYTSVSRNLYYHQSWQAAPNEYEARQNVNFNSLHLADGRWITAASKGYSLLMVPAVALSDVYHCLTGLPASTHFPLVTDWAFHVSAGWFHALWGASLVWLIYLFFRNTGLNQKKSAISSLGAFFLSNLFPQAGDSFAHILQLNFYLLSLLFLMTYIKNNHWKWLVLSIFSLAITSQIYNMSWVLLVPGMMFYLVFEFKNQYKLKINKIIFSLLLILFIGLIYYYFPVVIGELRKFKLAILLDGIWGLLFSSGKGIFLYSPLLLIPLIFSKKIKHKSFLTLTLTTVLLFIFFYAQSYMDNQDGLPSAIWHGGMSWGVRYLSPITLLGLLMTGQIFWQLNKKQKKRVVLPLAIVALYVQLLGTLLPYQTQYRGLPMNIVINGEWFDRYNYASYIPRYSPLYIQSKELIRRIVKPNYKLMDSQLKYYDHGTEPWPSIETQEGKTAYWQQWDVRSSVYENTFDFWWLRPLYYIDQPHSLILTILAINLLSIYLTGKKLTKLILN